MEELAHSACPIQQRSTLTRRGYSRVRLVANHAVVPGPWRITSAKIMERHIGSLVPRRVVSLALIREVLSLIIYSKDLILILMLFLLRVVARIAIVAMYSHSLSPSLSRSGVLICKRSFDQLIIIREYEDTNYKIIAIFIFFDFIHLPFF